MKISTLKKFTVGFMILAMALVSHTANTDAQTTIKTATATLTWTANTEADMALYRVYRGTTAAVCADTLTPLPALTNTTGPVQVDKSLQTFSDATIPQTDGSTICYEITAVDTSGNESGRSNRPVAVVNANPPSAPRNLGLGVVIK